MIEHVLTFNQWSKLRNFKNNKEDIWEPWESFIQHKFNGIYDASPNLSTWGIIIFEEQKDLTWFLLQI